MRIDQLVYFIETVKCGSFNKAAQNLYITQPALSFSINSLEKELSTPLLIRSTYGVEPTEFGKKVFVEAQQILDRINGWKTKVTTPTEKIVINFATVPLGAFLVRQYILPFLAEQFPDADLHVFDTKFVSQNAPSLEEFLKKNTDQADFDIALFAFPEKDDTIPSACLQVASTQYTLKHLCQSQYAVHFSKQSPLAQLSTITLEDLKNFPLAVTISSVYLPYVTDLKEKGFSNFVFVNSHAAMLDLVMNNLAISLIPAFSREFSFNSGLEIAPIADYTQYLHYYLLSKKHDPEKAFILEDIATLISDAL